MKTQPKNNNIEVSFGMSEDYERFKKMANYNDVCEILFANDFILEIYKHFRRVHGTEVHYSLKMRIGKITLLQRVSQSIVFDPELLRETFCCMQRTLMSLLIEKEWEE